MGLISFMWRLLIVLRIRLQSTRILYCTMIRLCRWGSMVILDTVLNKNRIQSAHPVMSQKRSVKANLKDSSLYSSFALNRKKKLNENSSAYLKRYLFMFLIVCRYGTRPSSSKSNMKDYIDKVISIIERRSKVCNYDSN